jgi:hypothetical protein
MKISPCPQLTAYGQLIIFICQKPLACNRLVMVMGGVSWKGGSQELVKPMTITRLKMEDACILCNLIEFF